MRIEGTVKIRILICDSCGKRALAFEDDDGNGTRFTDHKCAGMWRNGKAFVVLAKDLYDGIKDNIFDDTPSVVQTGNIVGGDLIGGSR